MNLACSRAALTTGDRTVPALAARCRSTRSVKPVQRRGPWQLNRLTRDHCPTKIHKYTVGCRPTGHRVELREDEPKRITLMHSCSTISGTTADRRPLATRQKARKFYRRNRRHGTMDRTAPAVSLSHAQKPGVSGRHCRFLELYIYRTSVYYNCDT